MIFSRGNRRHGRHARIDPPRSRGAARGPRQPLAEELGLDSGAGPGEGEQPVTGTVGSDQAVPPAPAAGPYDLAQAPAGRARLDLGSLHIPSISGVQVRVQANPDGTVARVVLVHDGSALQLAAYAAPRSEPIWDEVRDEIRRSLFAEGVAVEEIPGEYGRELRARVRTPEGLKDLRFIGVDGPRWLVRADLQGPAAVDPASSPELLQCLRGLVVDRGDEARPAKELLPLRLSAKMAAQVQQQAAAANTRRATTVAGASAPVAHPATTTAGPPAGANGAAAPAGRRKPSPRPRDDSGATGTSPAGG